MKKYNLRYYIFPFCTLIFLILPLLSTQETAEPGAGSVIAIVFPTLIFGLKYFKLNYKPYHVSAILMWVMCLFITLIGPFLSDVRPMEFVKYLTFVIFFILVTSYKFDGNAICFIAKGYVIAAIVISILIILSFLGGYLHVHPDEPEETQFLGRYSIGITGRFKNPNYLASYILVALLVVMYKIKKSTMGCKIKVMYLSIILLFGIALFLTGTRIALIVMALILTTLYLSSLLKHLNLKYIFVSIIILLSIFFVYGEDIANLIEFYLAGREMFSDPSREQSWLLALNAFYDNFLFGCGLDSWINISQGRLLKDLHNVFLEFALNQGLVGLLFLLHIFIYGCNRAKKNDYLFLLMILLVTTIPICFQNGLNAVNFWRFIIINRLALNYSIYSEKGLVSLLTINQRYQRSNKCKVKK